MKLICFCFIFWLLSVLSATLETSTRDRALLRPLFNVLVSNEPEAPKCLFLHQPPHSVNTTIGSDVNVSVVTVNCVGVSIRFLSGAIEQIYHYDLPSDTTGEKRIEAIKTFTNVSLSDDGVTFQFVAYHSSSNGDQPEIPRLSQNITLRVQGPPGPVENLACEFTSITTLKLSFIAPESLIGIQTSYGIHSIEFSLNDTTNITSYNASLEYSFQKIDYYRAYNITVTPFNDGSIGSSTNCTVYIPNVTQVNHTFVDVRLSGPTKATLNITTLLLNNTASPICPNCYPSYVQVVVTNINTGILSPPTSYSIKTKDVVLPSFNISIQRNMHFSMFILYCNIIGCINNSVGPFSSFDLQNVSVDQYDEDSIRFMCLFTVNSMATACLISINSTMNISIPREITELSVEKNMTAFDVGSFTWEAYAVVNGSETSRLPAFNGKYTKIKLPPMIEPNSTTAVPVFSVTPPSNNTPHTRCLISSL
jgi:hypothetical protein